MGAEKASYDEKVIRHDSPRRLSDNRLGSPQSRRPQTTGSAFAFGAVFGVLFFCVFLPLSIVPLRVASVPHTRRRGRRRRAFPGVSGRVASGP